MYNGPLVSTHGWSYRANVACALVHCHGRQMRHNVALTDNTNEPTQCDYVFADCPTVYVTVLLFTVIARHMSIEALTKGVHQA